MKHFCIVIFCVFFLLGCSDRLPEGVLKQSQMVELLTDLTIVDGYMSTLLYTDSTRIENKNYYATVYKKHSTTKAEFERSLKHYSAQPALLDTIYSQVNRKLDAKEARLTKIRELKEKKNALQKNDLPK